MNYEKAIAAYREAIEIDPKNAEAYVGLAEVYKSMGNYQQEWEVLREGSERTQDSRITDMLAEVTASIETIEGTEESSSTGETKESTEESTDPTEEPSVEPTTESTPEPTSAPEPTSTPEPTEEPTTESTPEPTVQPTIQPTATPTPTYSTTLDKYLADGNLTDSECNTYATGLGATGYGMKKDGIAFVFNYGEYILILGTSADAGGIYIATAYFDGSGIMHCTYYCEVGANSNSKVQIYSDGTYCTVEEIAYFEKLVSYMASHPDPNVMPSLDNAEWWPW